MATLGKATSILFAIGVFVVSFTASTSTARLSLRAAEPPHGTWSIVGADTLTREVGIAFATCVRLDMSVQGSTIEGPGDRPQVRVYKIAAQIGDTVLGDVAHLVVGAGAIVAQGLADTGSGRRLSAASTLLAEGVTPDVVLDAVTAEDRFSNAKQYGAVTIEHSAANFTGTRASDWAGAAKLDSVTAQGNLLVGPSVVEAALAAFDKVDTRVGSTLGDALLAAMEAGSAQGGDRRCPDRTALVAFLAVASPEDTGDSPQLWLWTRSVGGQNPVAMLRDAYDGQEDGGWQAWWTVAIAGPTAIAFFFALTWMFRLSVIRSSSR